MTTQNNDRVTIISPLIVLEPSEFYLQSPLPYVWAHMPLSKFPHLFNLFHHEQNSLFFVGERVYLQAHGQTFAFKHRISHLVSH